MTWGCTSRGHWSLGGDLQRSLLPAAVGREVLLRGLRSQKEQEVRGWRWRQRT